MRYEDVISTDTPEGVALEMTLAGVGSRFAAALIDAAIQGAALIALAVFAAVGPSSPLTVVFVTLGSFAVFFGYDIAFETRASGKTPGKRVSGLRVVRLGGEPVTFRSSSIRNLLRVIDLLPGMYLVGIVTILVSQHNQRLGDLAAGTLVVRDLKGAAPSTPMILTPELAAATADWDVSMVRPEDLAVVRRFLERRLSLDSGARSRLARDLAARIRPNVAGPPDGMPPESFLEAVVTAKAARNE